MIIKNIKIKNYKTYLSLDLDLSVKSRQTNHLNWWYEWWW